MRTLLLTDLKDSLILSHRLDHHLTFSDGVTERLLAVDILAGLTRMDTRQIVECSGVA